MRACKWEHGMMGQVPVCKAKGVQILTSQFECMKVGVGGCEGRPCWAILRMVNHGVQATGGREMEQPCVWGGRQPLIMHNYVFMISGTQVSRWPSGHPSEGTVQGLLQCRRPGVLDSYVIWRPVEYTTFNWWAGALTSFGFIRGAWGMLRVLCGWGGVPM